MYNYYEEVKKEMKRLIAETYYRYNLSFDYNAFKGFILTYACKLPERTTIMHEALECLFDNESILIKASKHFNIDIDKLNAIEKDSVIRKYIVDSFKEKFDLILKSVELEEISKNLEIIYKACMLFEKGIITNNEKDMTVDYFIDRIIHLSMRDNLENIIGYSLTIEDQKDFIGFAGYIVQLLESRGINVKEVW